MFIGISLALTQGVGVGAARWAPYPAPSGFHWEFVTSEGAFVTSENAPVVALVGN